MTVTLNLKGCQAEQKGTVFQAEGREFAKAEVWKKSVISESLV